MAPKIIKFQDLDKTHKTVKKTFDKIKNVKIVKHEQIYLTKKAEIEKFDINKHSHRRKNKKEMAQLQFDIEQVGLLNCSASEKRRLERERLIKLGAKAPKSHKNYKQMMIDKKKQEEQFNTTLNSLSKADAKILLHHKNKSKKVKKNDNRFFNLADKGATFNPKIGKLKSGMLKISKFDVGKMGGKVSF